VTRAADLPAAPRLTRPRLADKQVAAGIFTLRKPLLGYRWTGMVNAWV
jgi:hypothetical protein